LAQTHPDGVVADPKHGLEFLEGGVGMLCNAGLEFFGVELAPMAPALFGGQRSGLRGIQIPINGTPRQIKTPGGLGFGTTALNEFHHPFPQVHCISFHAHQPITLCPNVNMNCYIEIRIEFVSPDAIVPPCDGF
jgi:hypothetical protein